MATRLLAASFVGPEESGAELARLFGEGAAPSLTVLLRDVASTRFGFRIAGPTDSPFPWAFTQELASFCQSRGLGSALELSSRGPLPAGGIPTIELRIAPVPATAERFGAAVREFCDRSAVPVAIVAVLRPEAFVAITKPRAKLTPLPRGAAAVWSCVPFLLAGLPLQSPVRNAVWSS